MAEFCELIDEAELLLARLDFPRRERPFTRGRPLPRDRFPFRRLVPRIFRDRVARLTVDLRGDRFLLPSLVDDLLPCEALLCELLSLLAEEATSEVGDSMLGSGDEDGLSDMARLLCEIAIKLRLIEAKQCYKTKNTN